MSDDMKAGILTLVIVAFVGLGIAWHEGVFSGPEYRAQLAASREAQAERQQAFVLDCVNRASKPYGDNGYVVEKCNDAAHSLFY